MPPHEVHCRAAASSCGQRQWRQQPRDTRACKSHVPPSSTPAASRWLRHLCNPSITAACLDTPTALTLRVVCRELMRAVPTLPLHDVHTRVVCVPTWRAVFPRATALNSFARHLTPDTFPAFRGLTWLDLSACVGLTDALLEEVGATASLRALTMRHCDTGCGVTHAGWAHVGATLRQLDVSWCPRACDAWLQCTPTLTHLTAYGCTALSDEGIRHAARRGTLQHLHVSYATDVRGDGLETLARACGDTLTHLTLSACHNLMPAALSHIGTCRALRALNMGGCSQLGTDDDVDTLLTPRTQTRRATVAALAALTHLDLSGWTRLSDDALRALACLPRVASLALAGCVNLTPAAWHAWSGRLTCLNIRGCTQVDDDALVGVAPTLRVLDVSQGPRVGLATLAACASTLCVLRAENDACMDDAALACLRGSSVLRVVDVSDCVNVSDDGIRALRGVAYLKACRCERLTGRGVEHVMTSALRGLDLSGCTRVDDSAFDGGGGGHSLTDVRLAHCTRLTDAALRAMPRVRVLDVSGCWRVHGDTVAAHCTDVRHLAMSACIAYRAHALALIAPRLESLDASGTPCGVLTHDVVKRLRYAASIEVRRARASPDVALHAAQVWGAATPLLFTEWQHANSATADIDIAPRHWITREYVAAVTSAHEAA